MLSTIFVQVAQFGAGLQPATHAFSEGSETNAKTGDVYTAFYNMENLISNILGIATVGASLFFMVYFLLGAYGWMASEGDSGKLKKARDQMMHGAMGLIIVVLMYAVVGLIGSVLGLDILNPGEVLQGLVPA